MPRVRDVCENCTCSLSAATASSLTATRVLYLSFAFDAAVRDAVHIKSALKKRGKLLSRTGQWSVVSGQCVTKISAFFEISLVQESM